MANRIIVQKHEHGLRIDYYPVTEQPLCLTSIVIYKPGDPMSDMRRLMRRIERSRKRQQDAPEAEEQQVESEEEDLDPFDSDEDELGPVGLVIIEGVKDIPGVGYLSLHPRHMTVDLRPGYYWDQVEEVALALLKKGLGWDEVELVPYETWRLEAVGDITEEDEDDGVDKLEGIVTEDLTDRYSSESVTRYWPPLRIADSNGYFTPPFNPGDDDEERDETNAIGEKALRLVQRLLQIDGVYKVNVHPYNLDVSVSPAFNKRRIHRRVLRAIRDVYELKAARK